MLLSSSETLSSSGSTAAVAARRSPGLRLCTASSRRSFGDPEERSHTLQLDVLLDGQDAIGPDRLDQVVEVAVVQAARCWSVVRPESRASASSAAVSEVL